MRLLGYVKKLKSMAKRPRSEEKEEEMIGGEEKFKMSRKGLCLEV